ncbi:diphthamide biosynthesis protein 4 [Paraphoma chrysanthemicola]|uniref:Diphthamide biosynthesis protein 4 n=1 Tax=Paraphoma chrysanthemicola TaxID=798071 RepID=A0A8K0QY47_9PLEO|nr:diphthamide biosynthesis protein 4 [Paraphoma chrysanthemicola]
MAHTKDYYAILGLSAPHTTSANTHITSPADIRRAYKLALLAAHPDKNTGSTSSQSYTVDDVKHAYTILADAKTRLEYDAWVRANPGVVVGGGGGGVGVGEGFMSSEFVLGLEVLDLSDFDVLDPGFEFSDPTTTTPSSSQGTAQNNRQENAGGEGGEGEKQMEWTRACRCGAEQGFRILEEELGDAEARGEKEVLVGCEGCSLWVRVGFEVEVG